MLLQAGAYGYKRLHATILQVKVVYLFQAGQVPSERCEVLLQNQSLQNIDRYVLEAQSKISSTTSKNAPYMSRSVTFACTRVVTKQRNIQT